jgi:hypothetical protein
MRRCALALALATGLAPLVVGPASACTVDGVPSAFANKTRAVLYKGAPTTATYAYWARFAFPRAYRVGQRIAFNENDALVRPVLKQADLTRSWRWRFNDGGGSAAQIGDRVAHSYRRAGKYKVAVDAYYPTYHGWLQFDSITITIRR